MREEYTIELKKIDARRSLVVWVTPEGHKKYVVCSYYDHEKPVGEQWCWGHYFLDLWDAVDYARKEIGEKTDLKDSEKVV